MLNKIKYIYHKYLLSQEKCPKCNKWADYMGPVPYSSREEYLCKHCNNFFTK